MPGESWQVIYDAGLFQMKAQAPSGLVCRYLSRIPRSSRISDLGCGGGRNSIHLAPLGFDVHAYDVADVGQGDRLAARGVKFHHQSVQQVRLEEASHGAVMAMRLLQYLSAGDLAALVDMVAGSLVAGGIFVTNWTAEAGILDVPSIDVPKFSHSLATVSSFMRQSRLTIIHHNGYWTTQQGTNLGGLPVYVCELVAQK